MAKPETRTLQASQALPTSKHPGGRPTQYRDSIGALICARIAEGETLSAICRTPGLPARQTVHKWRRGNSQFDDDYCRARADQASFWADEIVEISDDTAMDTIQTVDKKGNSVEIPNHANVQRDRLRINTRQWVMAKTSSRYADKVAHDHAGSVEHRHTVQLSDRERMRRLATFIVTDELQNGALIDLQPDAVSISEPMTDEPASTSHAKPSPADIVSGNK